MARKMGPNLTPGASRLKALSGKACPHCGGQNIAWSTMAYFKAFTPLVVISGFFLPVLFAQDLSAFALLFLPSLLFLPTLRRCQDCKLTFKAPMARLFSKS